uniref:Ubiquitin associated protein 2a n=1 Tax=Tetraodon nigroviridis TaxID=99883 RepID=H3CZA4_TETNG
MGQAKRAQANAGAQILEQLKGPGLGPLPSCRLPSLGTSVPPPPSSSWDLKPSESSNTSQFSREFALQPEPSLILSQLVQRHPGPSLPLARQPSPPSQAPAPAPAPLAPQLTSTAGSATAAGAKASAPSTGLDPQGGSTQQQRGPLKAQKRRIPPASKIPSTAVEMPGSADIPGLNLQFGALDFGSESALTEFGGAASMAAGAQSQTSLYSKPLSESLGGPLSVALPLSTSEAAYHSSVALPNLAPSSIGSGSPANPPSSSSSAVSSNSSVPSSSHFSTGKESTGPVMNGLNGVRTSAALDALANLAPDLPSASQLTSLNSSASSLAPSSGSYTASQPSVSALHSTHNSSNSHLGNMSTMHSMSSTVAGMGGSSTLHSSAAPVSTALGLGSNGATATSNLSVPRTTLLSSSSGVGMLHHIQTRSTRVVIVAAVVVPTGKAPPNLSQGVPPLLPNQYIMGPGGLLPAYPIYGYEDLHMLQSRLPMDYYGITFPGPTAALSNRDGGLANNPYSGEVTKFGRNDSTSPAPPTSPAQGQNSSQQAFLPPGYSYTGLPYYAGVPGAVPSAAAFQYGPTMFVPPGGPGPASAKQHSMGLGLANPSASPFQQQTQQQPSGYGQHTFSSGYEELTAGPAGVDYSKGYNSSSQTQAKSAASGPGKGVSVTSSNSGVPDISGSVYNKTQSFDKQGFHAGTPPPFNLPSALGGPGALNPGAAPGAYAPAPFLHILPHQQPHSQLLHHHLAQDGQGGPGQRGQSNSLQQKSQVNKSSYGSSPYWAN